METYKTKIQETNLIDFWKSKADFYSTEKMNLTDDDTISDYIHNTYKTQFNLNEQEWTKMTRLIIADWFIQQYAFYPLDYKIIEYREVPENLSE